MSDSRFSAGGPAAPDPLGSRLDALRAETERLPTPAARSVRRRGNRRSAIQVASTTLAAASAIGIGTFVLPLGGGVENDPVTPSSTTTSTTTPTTDQPLTEVLITEADLPVEPGEDAAWVVNLEGGPTETAVAMTRTCGSVDDLGRLDGATRMFTNDGATYFAAHEVLLRASGADGAEAEATDEADAYAGYFQQCSGEGESPAVSREWRLLGGPADGGRLVEVVHPETPDQPGSYEHVAIADIGRVVVIVSLSFEAQDESTTDAVRELLRTALAGACTTTGADCTDVDVIAEPELLPDQGDSGEAGTSEALLGLEDMPTWDGALPWDTVEDVEEEEYGVDCHPLWADLGALSHAKRVFTVSNADPRDAVSATEVMATFPDEASAEVAVAAMRDGMATCKSRSVVADGVTVEMIDPLEFGDSAWVMTIPGGGETPAGRILVGFVRSGSTAALVTVSYSLDSELPGGPFLITLDLAASKLGR